MTAPWGLRAGHTPQALEDLAHLLSPLRCQSPGLACFLPVPAGAHGLSPRPCCGGIAPPALRHLGVQGSHRWGRRLSALCSSPRAPSSRGMKTGAGEGRASLPGCWWVTPAQPDPASSTLLSPCQRKTASGSKSPCPTEAASPAAADQTVSLVGLCSGLHKL